MHDPCYLELVSEQTYSLEELTLDREASHDVRSEECLTDQSYAIELINVREVLEHRSFGFVQLARKSRVVDECS